MTYYKSFDRNLCCRGFQFKEGETYHAEGDIELCRNGFHFCKDLVLTLEYYPVRSDITENKYAEVEVGEVVWDDVGHKGVTNKITVVRVLGDEEVRDLVDGHLNSGDGNSGYCNSGDCNSGNRNSGDGNSGYRNSGDLNSGNRNSGDGNSGYCNSGNWNSGNWNSGNGNSGYCNSGNWNSGNRNSGDWNSCDSESGFFNSVQSDTIRVFNKPCLRRDWESAQIPAFLYFTPGDDYKKSFQAAYDNASEEEKELLFNLPNFDADVFFEISGIRVEK